ncbi:MAG TPA: hypothetical protein VK530_15265 [Candidatus Acidoferrum sp.]|nr:hypothetical protein [Candidatus Acidoferrum sp.]
MSTSQSLHRRLAIAPTTRGFGFAVIERDGKLADWGAVGIIREKNATTVLKVRELIDLYRPEVLVIEDYAANPCRRSRRICDLGEALCELAASSGISLVTTDPLAARRRLGGDKVATKQSVAERLAEIFPRELGHLIPRKRQTWMKEDYRMAIFEAVALPLAIDSGRFVATHREQGQALT